MNSSAQSITIEVDPLTEEASGKTPVRPEKARTAAAPAAKVSPSKAPPASKKPAGVDSAHDVKELARRGELYLALGMILFMAVLFVVGRIYWDERYYVPEEGLGYWLGLVGGVMMLLAMVYGLFKHIPALRTVGWMKRWLSIHIVFGVVGPLLVLVHSTFRLGSLNGAVAMISMVLVFLSGVMGRFLYSKIHYGLGGSKAQLADVQTSLVTAGKRIKSRRLNDFSESVMSHPGSLFKAGLDLMVFGWRSRWLTFQLRRDMKRHLRSMAKREAWSATELRRQQKAFRHQLRAYMFTLRKVALFSVYERFFAFWRHAHVPLLYLLLFSGVAHVIAVHMY
jgi:hypothetical protein